MSDGVVYHQLCHKMHLCFLKAQPLNWDTLCVYVYWNLHTHFISCLAKQKWCQTLVLLTTTGQSSFSKLVMSWGTGLKFQTLHSDVTFQDETCSTFPFTSASDFSHLTSCCFFVEIIPNQEWFLFFFFYCETLFRFAFWSHWSLLFITVAVFHL